MKKNFRYTLAGAALTAAVMLAQSAQAQIGRPYIHDPSTIAECDGKY